MNLTTLWRLIIAVALLGPPGPVSSQQSMPGSCMLSAAPSRRLELSDGRIVSIDVKDVAESGGVIMALGRYAHVFPRDASPTTSPLPIDSTLGVWIDARGVVRLVTSPMRERSITFARAVGGVSGSFHVVFATGVDSVDLRVVSTDTATLWYARYTNGTWRDIERITSVTGAGLDTEFTSELLARGDDLSFLFPFVDGVGRNASGGLVALRRKNSRWSSDTLRTPRAANSVRARLAPDQSIITLLIQLEPGARAENVFLSRLTDRWDPPRRIGDGVRPVSDMSLVLLPLGPVASWSTWIAVNTNLNVLQWARLHARPTGMVEPAVIDSGSATYPFEFIAVGSYLLWFYHSEPFGRGAQYVLSVEGTTAVQRGNLTIPFHNARAEAVALGRDRLLLFTMKRGLEAMEPMMASWITDVRIRCPNSARR